MEKRNIKIKPLIKAAAFILAFVLIIELLSASVFHKKNASDFNSRYSYAYSFMQEPKNSIQIAAVGNSDLYSAFIPSHIWEKHGYTSTVISSPSQSLSESHIMLKDFLALQKPEVLIIETDMFYKKGIKDHKKERNGKNRTFALSEKNLEYWVNVINEADFESFMQNHFSIFLFHNKWKIWSRSNTRRNDNPVITHGYNYSSRVISLENKEYMKQSKDSEEMEENDLIQLRNILKLCRENGIKVVLTEMPSMTSWNYARHNYVQQFADENNLDFIDFNLMLKEINFDMQSDWRDSGNHLNYSGASKTTSYLGDYISKNFNIKSLKNDKSFDYWNDSVDSFKKIYNLSEADVV